MQISRKYPAFLLVTTVLTALGVVFALLAVLRKQIEDEVKKNAAATVESFASTNAPLLLTYPSDPERARARLQFNLLAVAKNPDVVNARLTDTRRKVIAALAKEELGSEIPAYVGSQQVFPPVRDPQTQDYVFWSTVRYGPDVLGYVVLTVSRAPLERALRRATSLAIGFGGGIAAVMCIFALLFVQREVRPLKLMRLTLSEIAKGDFSQRVPEERRDEIGELGAAFNRMLHRTELFFHYVDKMIIERLVADESLARPGGRERDLAVLFGDMRGYTAMSNRRNADQVVHIVNTYFHLFIECVAHWRGRVDKTMGDGIMAVFERFDDEPEDGHKRRAILALAYMKAASRVLNRFLHLRLAAREELPVEPREFGFAVATGRAIVGNIGSRRRMDYTVCGRVVNLAARLEGLTKNGEVIIDNFTRVGTTDLIQAEPLPPVQPKGFSAAERVVPHRLIGLNDEETQRLRIYMKKLFTISFLSQMLMPRELPVGEQQPWCREAEVQLIRIIAETPGMELFARADTATGALLSSDDPRLAEIARRHTGELGPQELPG